MDYLRALTDSCCRTPPRGSNLHPSQRALPLKAFKDMTPQLITDLDWFNTLRPGMYDKESTNKILGTIRRDVFFKQEYSKGLWCYIATKTTGDSYLQHHCNIYHLKITSNRKKAVDKAKLSHWELFKIPSSEAIPYIICVKC